MEKDDPHKEQWEILGGKNIALSKEDNDYYWKRYESCQRLLDQL